MDSSFLTFSPKALLRKKTTSKNASSLFRSKLAKSKILPLQEVCSPSNLKNITKSNKSSGGDTHKDSSIIILDDSLPLSGNDKNKCTSGTYSLPSVSKCGQQSRIKQNKEQSYETICLDDTSPREVLRKRLSDQCTPNEKFDQIKEWLDELHNIHQQKMYQPLWSTPSYRTLASHKNTENSSISNKSPLKLRISETSSNDSLSRVSSLAPQCNSFTPKAQTVRKCKVSESSSEESIKPVSHQNRKIIFSNDESDSESESHSLQFHLKSKLKILSSDSESDRATPSVPNSNSEGTSSSRSSRKSINSESVHQQKNIRNAEFACEESDDIGNSDTSTDKLLAELYGNTIDKEKVLTPKPRRKISSEIRKEDSRKSSSSVSELLNEIYGNTWCKGQVLTSLVNKTKIRGVKGKENTPPLSDRHLKVKKRTLKSNIGTLMPDSSFLISKTVKSSKEVNVISATPKAQETLSFLRSLSASPSPSICNPKALLYKKEFKKNKDALISELFKLFNSEVFENKLPSTMKIEWNVRMNRTAGYCYNSYVMKPEGKLRSSRIELSTKVCSRADRVRDTLIHEMCHAATWVIDGLKNGHGPQWKVWTRKATKKFPELPSVSRCHSYSIETKFTYKCKSCGYSIGRHSKSLDIQRKRCGYCYGEFELFVNTKSRKADSGVPSTPRIPRAAAGFALFVKENYKCTKQKNSGLSHAEMMKLLGSQYSSLKEGENQ